MNSLLVMTAIAFAISGDALSKNDSVVNGFIVNPNNVGFSINQNGKNIEAGINEGCIIFSLKNSSFTINTSHQEITLYLAEKETGEFTTFSDGTKVSRLSAPLSGASSPDETFLYIADYNDSMPTNNALNESHGLKKVPGGLYQYNVESLYLTTNHESIDLSSFSGDLFGYAWVDFNEDKIMGLDEVSKIKLSIIK